MKKSVLSLSLALLAFGASAQADGIAMNYASMSMSVVQFTPSGPSALGVLYPSLYLIPTAVYGLSPIIVLAPALSPHVFVTSPVILVEGPHIQPSFGVTMIGVQSATVISQSNAAMAAVITSIW